MPSHTSKKILIVPLDWGLGHTTRCIPIIKALLDLKHEVHIGGTAITNKLLIAEFPSLTYHIYPSYGISYPQKGEQFLGHIMKQLPHIAKVIKEERKITERLVADKGFDIVISDNRFGVRSTQSTNIIISHQLNLSVPQSAPLEYIANWFNKRYINRFDQVLVPDWDSQLLSGTLSSSKGIKPRITFLGNLSRWVRTQQKKEQHGILIVLSGPEPQRSLLENLLIEQSDLIDASITIVRAKPEGDQVPQHDRITFYNHLSADRLQCFVEKSAVVISRAGYSTIMDLVAVQKNAILIPTPGQTEQEYLVEHLEAMNLFIFYKQTHFNLSKAIETYRKKKWGAFPSLSKSLKNKLETIIA